MACTRVPRAGRCWSRDSVLGLVSHNPRGLSQASGGDKAARLPNCAESMVFDCEGLLTEKDG